MERKILVLIDETRYYQNLLHYLHTTFDGLTGLHYHLFSVVPCHLSGPSSEWLDDEELMSVIDSASRKRYQERLHHLERVEAEFVKSGFAPEQLSRTVRLATTGIVPAILFEAQRGTYDGLLSGKRDMSTLEKLVLGSLSTEMLSSNHTFPHWLVSGKVRSQRFLVPVDCSAQTLDAIDHLGFLLHDSPSAEITLFHSRSLLASGAITPPERLYAKWGREWCDQHLRGPATDEGHYHFHAAEQLLAEAGFPMARVKRLQSEKGIEPAQMIVHHVKSGEYGTIVMGRRGKEVSKGIFRGVSDRVLANVENIAVWVIG